MADRVAQIEAGALRLLGMSMLLAGFLGSLGLFAFQVYVWARNGEWWSLPSSDGLFILLTWFSGNDPAAWSSFQRWLIDPQDWVGVQKFLKVVPSALALLGIGILGTMIYESGDGIATEDATPR